MRIKFYSTRLVVLTLAVLLAGCSYQVQPIEKYVASDGSFSLRYPLGWQVGELREAGNAVWLGTVGIDDELGPDDVLMTVDVIAAVEPETGAARDVALVRLLDWYLQKDDDSPEERYLQRYRFDEAKPFALANGVEALARLSWDTRTQAVVFSAVFPIGEGIVGVATYWTDELEISPEREEQVREVLRSVHVTRSAQGLAAARPQSLLPVAQSYTTDDGFLRVEYPWEWDIYAEQLPGEMGPFTGMPMVVVGNFDITGDRNPGGRIPDDAIVAVILLVPNYLPEPGMEFMKLDAEGWIRLMAVGMARNDPGAVTGGVETLTLKSGATAYYVAANTDPFMHIHAVQLAERVINFSMVMVSPRFDNPALLEQAREVVDSARFVGEVDAFIAHVEEVLAARR